MSRMKTSFAREPFLFYDRYEICRCTGMRMVKEKFHGFGYVASCKGHFFTMFCVFSSQEPYLHVSAELRK